MKCNPWRWLWGIPLLAMWFWITFVSERAPIESDLALRAQNALEQAGQGWAHARFDGRDGVLNGRAPSSEDREEAAAIVRGVHGVRVVTNQVTLLKAMDRFVWSADYSKNQLILSGFVPNEQVRVSVLKAVKSRFPDVDILDRLKLARGGIEIKPWLEGVSFGLKQLSGLERGRLEFINMKFSLEGLAPSYAVYKDVCSALSKGAPSGVQLAKQDVSPPSVSPYTWRAKRTASQLVISGYVPSESSRLQLFEYSKKRFPKLAIIDRMETAAGAVPGWVQATGVLIDQLALLEEGEAHMKDDALGLTGRAPSKDIADQISNVASEDVPDSFTMTTDLTFPKPKPPRINPFVTSIDAQKSRVRLYGYVPNDEERAKLIQIVGDRFPDRTIVDDLKLGSGEPQSWRACLAAGLMGVKKLGAGVVNLVGQSVSVVGETMDEKLAANLEGDVRAAANRACSSRVQVKLNLPPEPHLNWSVEADGEGRITLEGEVPNSQTRSDLMAASKRLFPKAEVRDQMVVVQSFAKNWNRVAQTGISLLSKLRKGRATLSGQELVVSGEAKDTAVASAVKGQLKKLSVRGYSGRGELTVRSDSMIWAEDEAKRKAAADAAAALAANRQAEREAEQREAEKREAERLRKEQEALNRAREAAKQEALKVAQQRAQEELLRKSQEMARRKVEAEAEEIRRSQKISRTKEAELDAKREATRKKEADACGLAMKKIAQSGVIRFKFASSELDQKSHATLDEIAKQAEACSSFRIVVSGHTDSVGTKRRNMSLSQKRAQSVVDYLVQVGVEKSRLEGIGYGESRPIAPNNNELNRAKNRRIEFDVK